MQFLLLFHLLSFVLTPPMNEVEWHDIHLSKCSINWLESEQSVSIQLHIFRDDLTLALDAFSKDLTPEKETYNSDSFLVQYLESKLRIEINQREVTPIWVKKLDTEDGLAVRIHFEVRNIDYIHDIMVGYDALMEIYSDQRNIVDIKGPKGKRAYLLFSERGEAESMSFK